VSLADALRGWAREMTALARDLRELIRTEKEREAVDRMIAQIEKFEELGRRAKGEKP
jgi:hypothetical protein